MATSFEYTPGPVAPHVALVIPVLIHFIVVAVICGEPNTVDGVNVAVSWPAPLLVGVLMEGEFGGPDETTTPDGEEQTSPGECPLFAITQHLNECT